MVHLGAWMTLLALPLLAAGCGFQPVYGNKAHVQQKQAVQEDQSQVFAGVTIDPLQGRIGNQLQIELEDRLNPEGRIPPDPAYRLVAHLDIREVPIGVARDATVSRFNLYLDSHYTLYRRADGKAVTRGRLRHVGSYNNAANAYFSTYISREDGITRGVTELAELYRVRLASYLHAGAPVQQIKKDDAPPPHYYNPAWPGSFQDTIGAPIPGAIAIP